MYENPISHHARCTLPLLFVAIIAHVSSGNDTTLMDLVTTLLSPTLRKQKEVQEEEERESVHLQWGCMNEETRTFTQQSNHLLITNVLGFFFRYFGHAALSMTSNICAVTMDETLNILKEQNLFTSSIRNILQECRCCCSCA